MGMVKSLLIENEEIRALFQEKLNRIAESAQSLPGSRGIQAIQTLTQQIDSWLEELTTIEVSINQEKRDEDYLEHLLETFDTKDLYLL